MFEQMFSWSKNKPVQGIVLLDPTTGAAYNGTGSGGGGGGGTVTIDQTTPGTTESVTVKASAGIGSLTETAPASDTASSGLNGRLQRVAQRLTSLIALLPTALGQTTMANSLTVTVASDQSPVASKIDQTTPGTTDSVTVKASSGIGSLTESAPASDTASSGLNGRLQRIAQRLTSLIALVPGSLGQKTMANAFAVTVASDQSTMPIKQPSFSISTNFTRPADTTAYTIGDAISNATSSPTQLSFTVAAANQMVLIQQILIYSNRLGSPLLQVMAWVSGNTLASATFNDNAALDIDNATFILGVKGIACSETAGVASRACSSASGLNIPIVADASGKIYMNLSALNAYTPGNAEVFNVIVQGVTV